jgi:hypothetical protein
MTTGPLNCKQGDLALIVRGDHDNIRNIGKLVTCLSLEDPPRGALRGSGRIWKVDRPLTWRRNKSQQLHEQPYAFDEFLLPIRPEPDPIEEAIKSLEE